MSNIFNRAYLFVLFVVWGCATPSKLVPGRSELSDYFSICIDNNDDFGICYKRYYYLDETGSSYDWYIIFRNPTEFKFNEHWLIAKNNKRYLIIQHSDPPRYHETFKKDNYIGFKDKFTLLKIPDSLLIEPIKEIR